MANTKVRTKRRDWASMVREAEGKDYRQKEVAYQFSNGTKKFEPFNPQGTGVYDND